MTTTLREPDRADRLVGRALLLALIVLATVLVPVASAAAEPARHRPHLLAAGLRGPMGSTVGPDGALYVTEAEVGRIARVDPRSGHTTTFAHGLPRRIGDLGGAMDIAFVRHTAYVLVTLVGPDVGGTDVVGVYRVDGRGRVAVLADIGAWSIAHPPAMEYFVPSGVQYAMQRYRGGLLVTDGHHNRVLRVGLDGAISEFVTLPNVVPTGLAVRRGTTYVAEAGPVPHRPEDGRIVTVSRGAPGVSERASGAPLLVDVEFGPHGSLYVLSQGRFTPGNPEGSPADPNTGSLQRVGYDGRLHAVASRLDRPTSLEFIGHRAYIVTLTGDVLTIDRLGSADRLHASVA